MLYHDPLQVVKSWNNLGTTIRDADSYILSCGDDVIAEMYEHWDSDRGGSGDGGDDVASGQG